jgi:hypothetical protein
MLAFACAIEEDMDDRTTAAKADARVKRPIMYEVIFELDVACSDMVANEKGAKTSSQSFQTRDGSLVESSAP